MFFMAAGFFAILTTAFLVRSAKVESQQRSVLDKMNKQVESLDPLLFTGNSRNPNG